MNGEHDAAQESCPDVLKNARKSRFSYDADTTQELLTTTVKLAFKGNEPCKFQLDTVEALILGLNVMAIAGTGSGKTLPWVMPLLLEENKTKTVLVISPLKAPQADHVRFHFTEMTAPLLRTPAGCILQQVGCQSDCHQWGYMAEGEGEASKSGLTHQGWILMEHGDRMCKQESTRYCSHLLRCVSKTLNSQNYCKTPTGQNT